MTEMWKDRTGSMVNALEGARLSLTSDTLLDDLIRAGRHHPKVKLFLESLPGYPNDAATALRQLEYLVSKVRKTQRMTPAEKISDSLIVPVGAGRQGAFEGEGHLKNFVRYLMSQTASHSENERTKLNYVQFSGDEGGLGRACAESVQTALNHFQELRSGPDKLVNDLIYWAYSVRIGTRVISNMHVYEGETLGVEGNTYDKVASYMGETAMQEALERVFGGGADYVPIEKASESERLLIERELAHRAADLMKAPALLHVSHHDQDSMHHTHRITLS